MITQDNIQYIVDNISNKDKNRLKNTHKEYVVIEVEIGNAGSFTVMRLTNNLYRYKNISDYGNCILDVDDPVFEKIR